MGLFTRLEKERINSLEAEGAVATAERDALAEAIERQQQVFEQRLEDLRAKNAVDTLNLKSAHEAEKRSLVTSHQEQLRRLKAEQEAAANEHGLAIDALQAQRSADSRGFELDLARKDGEIAALLGQLATWRLVHDGHDWHKTHSVYVHGRRCDVIECLTCRTDPLAAARYVVPEGSWREIA